RARQKLGQNALVLGMKVLDDDDREAEVRRESLEEAGHRFEPAGGSTYAGNANDSALGLLVSLLRGVCVAFRGCRSAGGVGGTDARKRTAAFAAVAALG